MKNAALTPAQLEEVKILIRLGDSEELAIATVLAKVNHDNDDFYRFAYTN